MGVTAISCSAVLKYTAEIERLQNIRNELNLCHASYSQAEETAKQSEIKLSKADTKIADIALFAESDDWKVPKERDGLDEHAQQVMNFNGTITERKCETKAFYVDEPLATYGRLYIPSCDVNVPVGTKVGFKNGQAVVDAENLALIFNIGYDNMICDHAGQGFDKMKQSEVGTVAFIKTNNGFQKLVCTGKELGYNVKYALITEDGKQLGNNNADGLTMYTCNDETGHSVTITYWKYEDFNTDDFASGKIMANSLDEYIDSIERGSNT